MGNSEWDRWAHTKGEIKTGNARFHALFQFDLLSFDQNFLSFENS